MIQDVFSRYEDFTSLLVSRNILWKTPYMYCLNMLEMRHRYGRSETKLWTWFDMICLVALELGGLLFPASKRQPAPRHALRWWSWDWRPAPVISPKSSNISAQAASSSLIPFTVSVRTGKGLCSRSLCWCSALLGISGCWSERGQPEGGILLVFQTAVFHEPREISTILSLLCRISMFSPRCNAI